MKRYLMPAQIAWSAAGQSHGVAHGAVFKRLLIAGQPGVGPDGAVPEDVETQIRLAFDNLFTVVEAGQMVAADLVRLVAYVAAPGAWALFNRVREEKLGAVAPACSYVEAASLGDPRWLVLIEGEAVREARS